MMSVISPVRSRYREAVVGKLEASTVCLREFTRRVQLPGNQAAVDRVQRVAVDWRTLC